MAGMIIPINDKTRVNEDRLQWIVQRYRGDCWHSMSFCRQRDSLIRILTATDPGSSLEAINRLPEWHP